MAVVSSPPPSRPSRPTDTTILVVDDDAMLLTLVERTLRAEGYRVWTANCAAEARRVLAELAGAVDLVVTDVAMPGGLGPELAAQIRATQRWIRVLYMSSYSRDELLGHGIELPETQLMRKPFMPGQLLGRIREALAV
jgi:two-component system, cell cycle sensor histidine kinase and response regulator CckA